MRGGDIDEPLAVVRNYDTQYIIRTVERVSTISIGSIFQPLRQLRLPVLCFAVVA